MTTRAKQPKAASSGIAQKLIRRLHEVRASKIVDLDVFRQAKDVALQQRAAASEGLEDFHPLHAAYTYVVKTVADAANILGELPELSKLMDQIEATERDYAPDGPPLSPITRSYHLNWALFDITTGRKRESLGSCVAAVSRAFGSAPEYVEYVERLCHTRPGIYVHEGRDGDAILLRELVTDRHASTIIPSGYTGRSGDLLLVRLLLSCPPQRTRALALTTPYQIIEPGRAGWEAYFDRTLPKVGSRERVRTYEALMKYGGPLHGARYWTEYIFEAYSNRETEVVFLEGLPDVAESRPHADMNGDAPPQGSEGAPSAAAKPAAGKIVRALSADVLQRLPKLSETVLRFGEPILRGAPPNATVADLQRPMVLVELAWNYPLVLQQGEAKFAADLKRQMDARRLLMPRQVQIVMDRLIHERTTTYAHDPRLVSITVVSDGKRGVTIRAEARLFGKP